MPEIPNEVLILRLLNTLERAKLELDAGNVADGAHFVEKGLALANQIR